MGFFNFLKDMIIIAGVDHMLNNRGNNNHHGYDPGVWNMDDDHEMDSYDDYDCDNFDCDMDCDDFDF